MKKTVCLLSLVSILLVTSYSNAESNKKSSHIKTTAKSEAKSETKSKDLIDPKISKSNMQDADTEITSDSLLLDSKEKVFRYTGNVKVTRGDMILNSDELEGLYDNNNKIERLVAKKNVKITKGTDIKALGGKAEYSAATEVVTLTESPEIEQNGSSLTADSIKLYLNENRSEALGQVRVKVKNLDSNNNNKTSSKSIL